jgi:hypothetical protein
MTPTEVIEEMRTDCSRDAQVQRWADALEQAVREKDAEIARLKALWYADADPRETEYSEDYRACYGKEDKP